MAYSKLLCISRGRDGFWLAALATAEGSSDAFFGVSRQMRRRSWAWTGFGEAVSTILAAALAYLINVLTGEQHVRVSVVAGVIALVIFSALFEWGRRAIEARRSARERSQENGSPLNGAARDVTISGELRDSPVVITNGAPVVILSKVKGDSISVTVGADTNRPGGENDADQELLSRHGQRRAKASGLAKVADELAASVNSQWKNEANWRHLNDPYAMPVRWVPADSRLTATWPTLVRLATEGPGWSPRSSESWARCPADLAGTGKDLIDVLARVPTGRLVVLGDPGAGKTILMVRLILDLLARRELGQAVPILVPMASWDSESESLYKWMERWLITNYPALAGPWPGSRHMSRARVLLEEGFILPLLDGLDEMPASRTSKAIAKINKGLLAGQRLILAARTDAFRLAVDPPGGVAVQLAGAAGIELCPLGADVVIDYLRDSAGGQESAGRWDDVARVLAADESAPVTQALTTPLMAALARAIYNPRPDESLSSVERHPAELLNQDTLRCRAEVERHLFDVFIPAAYRPREDESRKTRWTADQAARWLTFLARDLQHRQGTTDFAWWQLPEAAPRLLPGVFAGLIAGSTAALTIPWRGWGIGVMTSAIVAFIVRRKIHRGTPGLARGLAGGVLGGQLAAIIALSVFGAGSGNTRLASFVAGGIAMGIVPAAAGRFYASLVGGFTGELITAFYERGPAFASIRWPIGSVAAYLVNGAALGVAVALAAGLYNRRTFFYSAGLPGRGSDSGLACRAGSCSALFSGSRQDAPPALSAVLSPCSSVPLSEAQRRWPSRRTSSKLRRPRPCSPETGQPSSRHFHLLSRWRCQSGLAL